MNVDSLRRAAREPECLLHPHDAERRGIARRGARGRRQRPRRVHRGRARRRHHAAGRRVGAVDLVGQARRRRRQRQPRPRRSARRTWATDPCSTTISSRLGWRTEPDPSVSLPAPQHLRRRLPHLHCSRSRSLAPHGAHVPSHPETLGALKRSPFASPERSISLGQGRDARRIFSPASCQGGPLFAGVLGYERRVMPQIVNALLSRHNFILLGLRGQAKSRILRALATLLDDAMPIVAGSEINDNPFAPISKFARDADRRGGRRHADRLGRPRAALRRKARDARRHGRRSHRRSRSDQRRARRAHALRRAHDPLRHASARQPRHLRAQRAARSRRQGAGRPVQHHAGRRRADQRLPDPPAARRAALLHRQSRGLHGARQDHHAAQGPHRQRDHHALSDERRARHGDHASRRRGRSAADGPCAFPISSPK